MKQNSIFLFYLIAKKGVNMIKKLTGVLFLSLASQAAVAVPMLTNGNFETGDFSGWNVGIDPTVSNGGRPYAVDPSGDGWSVQNTTNWLNPINGYSAFNGFDGGIIDTTTGSAVNEGDLDFYLQQSFSFNGAVTSANLSFSFDIVGGPSFSQSRSGAPTEDRVFDVSILDSSGTQLASVYNYVVAGTTTDQNPLQIVNVDLTSFFQANSGNGFILDFNSNIPQYFTGGARFVIDDINLDIDSQIAQVPEPSSIALLGLGLAGLGYTRRKIKA